MPKAISRRDFLKLSALTLGSLAFNPIPDPRDEREIPDFPMARIAVDRQTAIEHVIDAFRRAGVEDIVVVGEHGPRVLTGFDHALVVR